MIDSLESKINKYLEDTYCMVLLNGGPYFKGVEDSNNTEIDKVISSVSKYTIVEEISDTFGISYAESVESLEHFALTQFNEIRCSPSIYFKWDDVKFLDGIDSKYKYNFAEVIDLVVKYMLTEGVPDEMNTTLLPILHRAFRLSEYKYNIRINKTIDFVIDYYEKEWSKFKTDALNSPIEVDYEAEFATIVAEKLVEEWERTL